MTETPLPIVLKDHPGLCRPGGPWCRTCRGTQKAQADWREAQTGQREFTCPFEGMETPPAPPKPARAPFALVQARVAMPCTHRTPDGRCALSKTCKGHCTCRTVAEWRDCPAGLWFVFVKTNIIHQPFNS